jgi:CheY-like chemotaxis protein
LAPTTRSPTRTRPRATTIAAPLRRPWPHWRRASDGEDWRPPRPEDAGQEERSARDEAPAARAAGQPRVLIVDDERAIRLLCRINLGLAGMEVLEATDGAAGLAAARREHPDLILLDVMMPDVDGWEVARELARDEATRDIPIVFLTARAERVDELRGYEAGAVAYVTKPFDPVWLGNFLHEVIERVERGEGDALRAERMRRLNPPDEPIEGS